MVRFLKWLLGFFEKPPQAPEQGLTVTEDDELSVFRQEEQAIYEYWDGRGMVKADPLVLFKRWAEKFREIEVDIKIGQSDMKDADEALFKGIAKIRWIFNLKPLEEGGLTVVKTLELYNHYCRYLLGVKKNSGPTPPSCPPSGSGGPPLPDAP